MKLNLFLFIFVVYSTVAVLAASKSTNVDLSGLNSDIINNIKEGKCKVKQLFKC